jgi:hypothetical protein
MSYIDVLIQGIIGLLLVASPWLFTKTHGETFEKPKRKQAGQGLMRTGRRRRALVASARAAAC